MIIERAGRRFVIADAAVREVAAPGELTSVPTAPSALRGLVQVHGQVVPAIEPSGEGAPTAAIGADGATVLVVVEGALRGERARAALLVDAVIEEPAVTDAVPLDVDRLLAEIARRIAAMAEG